MMAVALAPSQSISASRSLSASWRVSRRVDQAQAGEMGGLGQRAGGGGQQQHGGNASGQLFDQLVFGAGAVLVPDQMVRLVHYQHVPVGGLQPFGGAGIGQQILQG